MSTINIWTTQMGKWRIAKANEIKFYDITAKGVRTNDGHPAFAPEYRHVIAYKNGEMNEMEYTQLYIERMQATMTSAPEAWAELENNQYMAFACFCPMNAFCHRHLFKDLVVPHLEQQGHEVIYHGELF